MTTLSLNTPPSNPSHTDDLVVSPVQKARDMVPNLHAQTPETSCQYRCWIA